MKRRYDRPIDAPLFAWGERETARRWNPYLPRWLAAIACGVSLAGVTIVVPPRPRLIWNSTASAPLGLYWIEPGSDVEVGDTVAAWPPRASRRLAVERHYLPGHIPLIKAVGAIAGDDVCAFGQEILINGVQAGDRQLSDAHGRPLPGWTGCRRLRGRDLFLFNRRNPASFDGRYFGIVGRAQIIGKAHLIWAR